MSITLQGVPVHCGKATSQWFEKLFWGPWSCDDASWCTIDGPLDKKASQYIVDTGCHKVVSWCFIGSVGCDIMRCPGVWLAGCFIAEFPGGCSAGSTAAGGRGCRARLPSRRRTGRRGGPAPRRSGAGRNPWPPGRRGWRPQCLTCPCDW